MTPKETLLAEFENLYGKEPIDGYVPGGECADSWHYASEKTAFIRGARAGLILGAKQADMYAEAAGGYDFKTSKRKTSECIANSIRTMAKQITEFGPPSMKPKHRHRYNRCFNHIKDSVHCILCEEIKFCKCGQMATAQQITDEGEKR